jgi:hypothetical protein
MEHDPNPYDFVPFEGQPSIASDGHTLALDVGLTGQLRFALKALTPISILQEPPSPQNPLDPQATYRFARVSPDIQRVIPASSIKGMLRAVHETVTNSRMGAAEVRPGIPSAYLPTADPQRPSPSEALFGFVSSTRSSAGRVMFGDIPIENQQLRKYDIPRPEGGLPKPSHRQFYFDPDGWALGRKFYYHQDPGKVLNVYGGPRMHAEAIRPGVSVRGALRFTNLTESELASLVYALVLDPDRAHKIGYGKPYGYGSAEITVERIEIERSTNGTPERFLSWCPDRTARFDDWTGEVERLISLSRSAWRGRPRGEASYEAFRAIAWVKGQRRYMYPSWQFFKKDPAAATTTLADYQGRTTLYPTSPDAAPVDSAAAIDQIAAETEDPEYRRAVGAGAAAPMQEAAQRAEETTSVTTASASSSPGETDGGSRDQPASPSTTGEGKPGQVSSPSPLVTAKATVGRYTGRLTKVGTYPPFIEAPDKKKYRLDDASAARDVVQGLLERVEQGERPLIRYDHVRERVRGKNENVLRNVAPVKEDEG